MENDVDKGSTLFWIRQRSIMIALILLDLFTGSGRQVDQQYCHYITFVFVYGVLCI